MMENKKMENDVNFKKLSIFTAAFFFLVSGSVLPVFYFFKEDGTRISSTVEPAGEVLAEQSVEYDPFENISLEAKSAYVWDVYNQEAVFSKNPDERLPLASVSKIMTALTALDILPGNTVITIEKEFLEEEGDSGLFVDEKWFLKDLMDFSLLVSSNDGVRAIASVVGAFSAGKDSYQEGRKDFVSKMNEKAVSLGLNNTVFYNESGLDLDDKNSGAYGTARDVAMLLEYAVLNYPDLIESTGKNEMTLTSLSSIEHVAKNTNINVYEIPGIMASKTGYTDLAGGNLAVAFDPAIGRPFIAVVLGSGRDGRFDDISELVKRTFEYLEK